MAATIFDEKFSSFFGGKFFIFQKIEKKVSLRFIVFRIGWICLFSKVAFPKFFLNGNEFIWRERRKNGGN